MTDTTFPGHDAALDSARQLLASVCKERGWKPDELQWKWRTDPPAYPTNPEEISAWQDECLWAIIDALTTQGGIIAWPGDGTSCAQQIVVRFARRTGDAAAEIERLRSALAPFAAYAPSENSRIPDDMTITVGSPLAKRQLTIGDFRRARAALAIKERG